MKVFRHRNVRAVDCKGKIVARPTEAPDSGMAVRMWRKLVPEPHKIPELNTQTLVTSFGFSYIGLYHDKCLIGALTDRSGSWEAVSLDAVRAYEPPTYNKLVAAYGEDAPSRWYW